MPHDAHTHVLLWLEYALADLALARVPLPAGSKYELLLFHAQQAAEKSLKAVLTQYGIDFPYTHSLQRLVELIPETLGHRDILLAATPLTEFAVLTRYPVEIEPVSIERYERFIRLADDVYQWALTIVQAHETDPR